MSDDEITTEQAAQILKCSPRTIRNMIQRGTLPARMDKTDPRVEKGVYRIHKSDVIEIKKNRPQ